MTFCSSGVNSVVGLVSTLGTSALTGSTLGSALVASGIFIPSSLSIDLDMTSTFDGSVICSAITGLPLLKSRFTEATASSIFLMRDSALALESGVTLPLLISFAKVSIVFAFNVDNLESVSTISVARLSTDLLKFSLASSNLAWL